MQTPCGKRVDRSEHSRDQTVSGDFVHWKSDPIRHEAEHGEDDEAAENAGRTVDNCSNDRVPATL